MPSSIQEANGWYHKLEYVTDLCLENSGFLGPTKF